MPPSESDEEERHDPKEVLVDVLRSALPQSFSKEGVRLKTPPRPWWRLSTPKTPLEKPSEVETVTAALRQSEREKMKQFDAKIAQIKRKAPETTEARKDWFEMPSSEITEEVKRDLEVLSMRAAFNPKKHYRSLEGIRDAKWVQVGTVMDHPADGKRGRLPNRLRKRTLTQQWMADPEMGKQLQQRFERLDAEDAKLAVRRVKQFPSMSRRVKRRQ